VFLLEPTSGVRVMSPLAGYRGAFSLMRTKARSEIRLGRYTEISPMSILLVSVQCQLFRFRFFRYIDCLGETEIWVQFDILLHFPDRLTTNNYISKIGCFIWRLDTALTSVRSLSGKPEVELTQPSSAAQSVPELHPRRVVSGRVDAVLVKTKNCLLLFTLFTILNMFHVI